MSQLEEPITGIAIIGLAGRFPKAPNVDVFWENVCAGREGITFFTEEELAATGSAQPLKDPRYVKARGVLSDADLFDAAFFGINPKEAEILDPQHRIFLETAWEALERAGYDPEREPGLIGVFAGMSMNTYLPMNLLARPGLAELVGSYALMLANDKDYLPTRVSYKLNLRGPSVNVQTGCSSSLVAVAMACQQLLNYQCDLALAGGVSVSFPQKRGHLFQEGSIYSPDGHCRTFDAAASGTVGGEGVGIVVLKRAAEAVADGDEIWGIIKGFAINNDGAAKGGYTAPSESGQAECIALAQAMADIAPETIGYLEAHGTGTPLGDPIEVAGLTRAFRAGTTARQFCALGSVKSHIGHLDAAAGVAGLITATLALRHQKLPPCLHFQQPNPKIDLANSPFYVNAKLRDWPANGTPRRAGVSSFGIGGTNAHVLLEEAPPAPVTASRRPAHVLVLSAKTEAALETAATNLANHLRRHPVTNLPDVAYTLQFGRRAFRHRRAVVCRDLTSAVEGLQAVDTRRLVGGSQAAEEPKAVFLFPGQGAQRIHMGRELYEHEPEFRRQVVECAELLLPHLGRDIRELLYPQSGREEWAREQLTQTQWTQPALFMVEYALARLWMSWGIHPAVMIGHSLGEYTAACMAGVLPLEEALRLVALRGRLMQEQPAGTMLAARLPETEAATYANGHITIAAVNSPNLSVFSGEISLIEALRQQLTARGVVTHRLETSHAFHSPMMEPVRQRIVEVARQARLSPPQIPYLSNVTGDWITAAEATDPEYYGRHLRQTVRFADGVGKLLASAAGILIEVGPGQTLSTFARQHPDFKGDRLVLTSLHHAQAGHTDTSVLLHALGQAWAAGAPVNWKALHTGEPRRRVVLPTYPFERKRFFVDPAPQFLFMAEATPEQEATLSTATASAPAQRETATPASPPVRPGEDLASRLQKSWSALSGLEPSSLDPDKTFTELGMDSLFLSQASLLLEKEFGVRIPFDELLHKYPTLRQLAGHLESPNQHVPEIAPAAVQLQNIPLTAAQKEIWFAVQRGEAAATAFNHGVTFRLEGPLDVPVLCRVLQTLADRHEALRLTFSPDGQSQRVGGTMRASVAVVDFSLLPPHARDEQMNQALAEAARKPFDLAQGPVWRAQVIKLGTSSHVFQLVVHHLACDGGSLGVLLQELGEFYTAGTRGTPPPAEATQPFSEFAWAQHQAASSPACARTESYWLLQYSQPIAPLELPRDHPRPARLGYAGASASLSLCRELTDALKRLSAAEGCTLFTTLLSGYAVLLGRLSRQSDIAIGIPITRRAGVGSDRLLGHCVNFLPLRLPVNRDHTLQDQLRITREAVRGLQEHADYTLGSLLQKLKRPRDPSRPSLVSVMFNLDWVRSPLRLPGAEAVLIPGDSLGVPFELSFNLAEWDNEVHCLAHYHTELFNAETVNGWLAQYRNILRSLATGELEWIGEGKTAGQVTPAPAAIQVQPAETELTPEKQTPASPTEIALAQMWREVIGVSTVSRHDDFFDLGGHSVLLTQVITRVRKRFGVDLTLGQVFESPTVASLAEVIENLVLEQLDSMSEAEAERQAAKLEPASKE